MASRGHALVRFAFLLCYDVGRAEDLVQDALFGAYRRWSSVSAMESPEAYVRRSIVNGFLGWRRRRISTEIVGLAGPEGRAADLAESQADRDLIWRLMAGLSDRQRVVLVLRYYEDLPDAEIAAVLGCPPATVRSLAARAMTTLRAHPQLANFTSEIAETTEPLP